MIYLLASILSSTSIILLFKYFERFNIDNFTVIVINYFVCVLTGSLVIGKIPLEMGFWQEPWFPLAFGLSFLFIIGFNIVATTVLVYGVSISTIMQKMSILISALFAIVYFNEAITSYKIGGILLAIIAVILTNIPSTETLNKLKNTPRWWLVLPLVVMATSGIIEISMQYVEQDLFLNNNNFDDRVTFISFLFLMAGTLGLLELLRRIFFGKTKVRRPEVIGGIALGIPNFFSIYFMLKVLQQGWEGSVAFPVNNVSIIILTAILGFLLFSEKLSKINLVGLVLAILAILLFAI